MALDIGVQFSALAPMGFLFFLSKYALHIVYISRGLCQIEHMIFRQAIVTIVRSRRNDELCEIFSAKPIWNGSSWSGTFYERNRAQIEDWIGQELPLYPSLVFYNLKTREIIGKEHYGHT